MEVITNVVLLAGRVSAVVIAIVSLVNTTLILKNAGVARPLN